MRIGRVALRIGGLLDRLVRAMQVKIEGVISLKCWSCAFIGEKIQIKYRDGKVVKHGVLSFLVPSTPENRMCYGQQVLWRRSSVFFVLLPNRPISSIQHHHANARRLEIHAARHGILNKAEP